MIAQKMTEIVSISSDDFESSDEYKRSAQTIGIVSSDTGSSLPFQQ